MRKLARAITVTIFPTQLLILVFEVLVAAIRIYNVELAALGVTLPHLRHLDLRFFDVGPSDFSEKLMLLDAMNRQAFLTICDDQGFYHTLCSG